VVLGQPVLLLTEAVGRNDEAVAVRVSGFVSKNETPHDRPRAMGERGAVARNGVSVFSVEAIPLGGYAFTS